MLQECVGSDVHISDAEIGLFNRVTLTGVCLKDLDGDTLLACQKLSVLIKPIPLILNGDIGIRSIELVDPAIHARKKTNDCPYNFEFLKNAFSSDASSDKQAKLQIHSIVIRNATLSHRLSYVPANDSTFDFSNLLITNLNTNLSLKYFDKDSINFRIRALNFSEHSGLCIEDAQFHVTANRYALHLGETSLRFPHGKIVCTPTVIRLNEGNWKTACGNLTLHPSSHINLCDLAFLKPALQFKKEKLTIGATIFLSPQNVSVNHFTLQHTEKDLLLDVSATANRIAMDSGHVNGNLHVHRFQSTPSALCFLARTFINIDDATEKRIGQIGNLQCSLQASFRNSRLTEGQGNIKADAVQSRFSVTTRGKTGWKLAIHPTRIDAARFDLAGLGEIEMTADIEKPGNSPELYRGKLRFDKIEYDGYAYRNVQLEGSQTPTTVHYRIDTDDSNLKLSANGHVEQENKAFSGLTMQTDIIHFNPEGLHLSERYPDTHFEGHINIELQGTSADDMNGFVEINRLKVESPDTIYQLNRLHAQLKAGNRQKELLLNSDFMDATLKGKFKMAELPVCMQHMLANNLPAILAKKSDTFSKDNTLSFDVNIYKSDFFKYVLKLPIHIYSPILFSGYMDGASQQAFVDGSAPHLLWNESTYRGLRLYIKERSDTLQTLVQLTKQMKNSDVKFALEAQASNDQIRTNLRWKDLATEKYQGEISLQSNISAADPEQAPVITTLIQPTQILINDSIWTLARSMVYYQKGSVKIQDFKLSHKQQYLVLNGSVTSSAQDSISARLNAINLEYLFNVLNFHPVDFTGFATGTISVNKDAADIPTVNAQVFVKDFVFNGGRMGDMQLKGGWNSEANRIDLDADIADGPDARTKVKGFVSLKEDRLDLNIQSRLTNLAFLNSFLSGIIDDIQGRTTGWCRLFGPLKQLDIEGREAVDLSATLPVTNTRYTIRHDSIHLDPGRISFRDVHLIDKKEHAGTLNGELTHKGFSDFCYSFLIKPDKLLIYDQPSSPELPFYGSVYGSGNVTLNGRPGALDVDVSVSPETGTRFFYNADQPDGTESFQLLKIVSRTDSSVPHFSETSTKVQPEEEPAQSSDIRLNFVIDVNPEAEFNIILDEKSGDYIRSTGYGPMRATFYNKGSFQMFGTYNVVDGVYKMSMQDIIRKDFQLTPGGRIIFGGNPNDGDLAFSAVHTVNSASLSDLNIGNNFSSTPTKVNCILNFGGKVKAPRISFDLDLPNINTDEKQMIRNLISTEEDMNMQIIYLLSIGRFYTYDYNQAAYGTQSQSSVAVQSLLSTTLSSQLNSMLANVLDNKNWTIGTNFSTGNTGWNDMEVAGILSGRLLNNRLIINGNFGYRERPEYTSNFIGDFNIQWLLNKSGNVRLKAYSEINDRYFTKSTLSTQGGGVILRHDFDRIGNWFGIKRKRQNTTETTTR